MGYLRLVYRFPLLLAVAFVVTPLTVLCQFRPLGGLRLAGTPLSEVMLSRWGRSACRTFGLKLEVEGKMGPGACLVVANHISWIDIHLLLSVAAMGFVAKAEISDWPVVGWLAKVGGTVFHRRGSHDSASGVASAMEERLCEGGRVAIFPEGGILPGDNVKRFHARLFAAAIHTGVPVQPVMLRYLRRGEHYQDITFLPGEKTLKNFFRLLRQEPCTAQARVLPAIDPAGRQRRPLAEEAETAIRLAFNAEAGLG
jgi:1-acyl-sn-glycerol-3-phosphate acyltransferase